MNIENSRFTLHASRFTLISVKPVACGLWRGCGLRLFCFVICPLFFVLSLGSCQLTDHTEGENEITAAELNVPASGYQDIDTATLPRFAFDSTSLDFGRISQGSKIERSYRFTNVGGGDLVITDVRASCGCTVAKDWPKQPVHPGERGTITVTYDSDGRSGRQEKVITVVANTRKASTPLFLHGDVVAPAGAPVVE